MAANFPPLGEETHPGPGSRGSSKQDELKETHTKTCYGEMAHVKDKETILDEASEKQVTHKGTTVRLSADCFLAALQARMAGHL